jgi:hypothetical protein
MQIYTKDEYSLLIGILLSALVSGCGIYQLIIAAEAPTEAAYLATVILGAMLFNAGVSGVTSISAIWYNYRAIL